MKKFSEGTMMNIYILVFGLLMVVCILMVKERQPEKEKCLPEDNHYEITVNIKTESADSLTICQVEQFLKNMRVEHWEIVLAQVILESGRLKSNLTKTNNNLVGMKYARQRPTTATQEKNGYAYYEDWKYCLMDYMIWQSRYAKKLSVDEYYDKLSSAYAEDTSYVEKLKEIVNGRI